MENLPSSKEFLSESESILEFMYIEETIFLYLIAVSEY